MLYKHQLPYNQHVSLKNMEKIKVLSIDYATDEIKKRGKELLLSSTDIPISEGRIINKEHGR